MMKNYINLGCGSRFHPAWTNVDFIPCDTNVIAADVVKGIPFPDRSFDMVYHSHLLEHLSQPAARDFLKECYRVLRPKGILRIAVPDLEVIAHHYLLALEQARAGSKEAATNYDWIMLEMYDQAVRTCSGGEMAAYLRKNDLSNEEFIVARCGIEVKRLIESARQKKFTGAPKKLNPQKKSWLTKFFSLLYDAKRRREMLLKLILKNEYEILQLGRFHLSGEMHQWMYDRFSLDRLLMECGFSEIVSRTATESYLPDWSRFNLDSDPDGSTYKPDSLFMEAVRP
jgi:predicted SAM-dependent methyltransferase